LPAAGCETVTTQLPVATSVITPVEETVQAGLVVAYVRGWPEVELAAIGTVPPLV